MATAERLFGAWAAAVPERLALVDSRGRMSYAELDALSTALAGELVLAGVVPGDRVGIFMDRSFLLPATVLAVWKAGAAYVPLPPAQPTARTALVLADTAPRVVAADRDPAGGLGEGAPPLLRFDGVDVCDGPGPAGPAPATGAGDLAYVLYTSGSTGTPKGVMVEHGGVVNLAEGLRELFGDLEGARVLQFAPFTFDVWVWELAMSLLNGGTLCIPPAGAQLHGLELARFLRELCVSHLSAAPSLLATLPTEPDLPLTTLTSGGEPLPGFLVERWAPRLRLFNAYGPTEATVSATAGRCHRGQTRPSIGRPLTGVEVHLLDAAGRPVERGRTGELCIGGRGVARGYLNRPDLTRERFVPDPFSGRAGARLYRTGDLARYLPEGDIEFAGRIDDQLNLRGYRIEPGEVEAALLRYPGVTGAAVTVTGLRPESRRLTAYLQFAEGRREPVARVRGHLSALLPAHLVPSLFVVVDRLPLNAHGKVDRAALPDPGRERPETGTHYTPPEGEREREVAELLEQILGIDGIGADDEFFALGGTSADLIELQARVQEQWGIRVPAAELVAARTVRMLAELLDTAPGDHDRPLPKAGPAPAHADDLLAGSRTLRERLRKGRQG
ncbi:hypothetical protein GCM10027294_02470 [Marinactinospora endophytica]